MKLSHRVSAALLSLTLAAALVSPAMAVRGQPSSWAKTEVDSALAAGIVPDLTGDPGYQDTITREQFAELAYRTAQLLNPNAADMGPAKTFTDCDNPTVLLAASAGIVNGTGDGTTFSPNTPTTREQIACMILRTINCAEAATGPIVERKSGLEGYSDAGQVSSWAANDMGILVHNGLMKGTDASTLSPAGACTVEQSILLLYRVYALYTGQTKPTIAQPPADSSAVSYEKKSVNTSAGAVTAHVLTVDTKDPKVSVKTAMVNNTIGATAPFSQIVESSGAVAVVNGNFFNSYDQVKNPIGHVMVNGEFLNGSSGLNCLGITADGELRVGRPALFARVRADNTSWSGFEINALAQSADGTVLYTPAFGQSAPIKVDGAALTVQNGVISAYTPVQAGQSVAIPADGYVLQMGTGFTTTAWFQTPVAGQAVELEYYLTQEDPEGFTLDGLQSVISGAPRLVQDGQTVTTLEPGFQEARFTTSVTPRTAVGVNGEGKLVLVSVPAASIQQMRELMLALGCVDAFNLDGGGSCAMYYDGTYLATPGRELTVTLQVFVAP